MQWYHNCFASYTASWRFRYHKLRNSKCVTNRQKHHTFSSTAGARPMIPTILGTVIEEVRPVFAPPNFFDPISSFAARGY